jgi:hypothetical protein
MYALALLVIALSGYVSFAKKREGADPARSVGEAMLLAVLFVAFLEARLTGCPERRRSRWLIGPSALSA